MVKRSCIELAIDCPDVACPRCGKPYQTWIWKETLLFTCPECEELGFSVEGIPINKANIPENSFFSNIEMPCDDDLDPACSTTRKMLFIDHYQDLDFLLKTFQTTRLGNNYSDMQKSLGTAYEMIIDRITL
ncbi:MAG: hypothetical protein JW939_01215 [Candidatus Thermoplasmatota archaeon]|nr:hypothetical protein [Candidatus Thermoplasmatota archaeon]